MDSQTQGASLIQLLISVAMSYLDESGPTREAAGFCLANLFTRPDMESQHLEAFLRSTAVVLQRRVDSKSSSNNREYFEYIGMLSCLNQIFKRGHRSKLVPLIHLVYANATSLANSATQTIERKLLCKLIQRLGMTFLPPKEASWRYQRGQRSLMSNLIKSPLEAQATDQNSHNHTSQEVDNESVSFPDELEDIIGLVISFLSDKDTVVRWSAAKGVGRITMRLTKALAADVLQAILALFEDSSADMNWHGGCLAIAELSRRGLLLPEQLGPVVEVINQGMRFDLLRGQYSVGAHVRDAACYVCWAFARAYSSHDLESFCDSLFENMLVTSLFDREVNCRRAASAALQEFVGRQGHEHFSHSLTIISIADFFAVGNRTSAYLELSTQIAALDTKYHTLFIEHLCSEKFNHWDDDIRLLSAKGVARLFMMPNTLVTHQSSFVKYMEMMLASVTNARLAERHGAMLVLSNTLLCCISVPDVLPAAFVSQLDSTLCTADKLRLFRGKGGEQVREAYCNVLQTIARIKLKLPLKSQVALIEIVNDQLRQPHEGVQRAAQKALRMMLFSFFGDNNWKEPTDKLQALTVTKYLTTLPKENNVAVVRGYLLALGILPARIALLPVGKLDQILDLLCVFADCNKMITGEHDVESSRNALESLVELTERLYHTSHFSVEQVGKVFEALFRAAEDYSVDKRGDTGSWCRSVALLGLERLLYMITNTSYRQETDALYLTAFGFGLIEKRMGETASFVRFSNQSLGHLNSITEDWVDRTWQDEHGLVLFTSHSFSENDRVGNVHAHLTNDQIQQYIVRSTNVMVKQAAEKLDNIRELAGATVTRLLAWYLKQTDLPREEYLVRVHKMLCEQQANLQWSQASQVYPVICKLLFVEELFDSVMSGLVISIGGVTKSISKAAAESLLSLFTTQSENSTTTVRLSRSLAASMLMLLSQYKRVDRVILPVMKTVEIILKNNLLSHFDPSDRLVWLDRLFEALQQEMRKCTNIPKIMLFIDVLPLVLQSLTSVKEARIGLEKGRQVLNTLAKMLVHKYPKIRKRKLRLVNVLCIALLFVCAPIVNFAFP